MVVIKKIFLWVLIVLLVNPLIYGAVTPYGYGGGDNLVVSRPDDNEPTQEIFYRFGDQGYIKNKAPITNPNYPTDGKVVNGNLVEFGWSYYDDEDDEQLNYNLEIDDDPGFYSPLSYFGLSENTRKVYLVEGNKPYYWRVRSKDIFGWGRFSLVQEFYIDLSRKVCEDGTPYFQCSSSDFKYCDSGELIDDCGLCGCPLNSKCTLSGICSEKTCFDGTRVGFCSNKKPNFCQNGELKEVCSLCGCADGKECGADGTCKTVIVKEKEKVEMPAIKEKNGFFSGVFGFLRFVFGF